MCDINQFRDTNIRAFHFQVGSKLCRLVGSIQSLSPGSFSCNFFFSGFFVVVVDPGELKGIR